MRRGAEALVHPGAHRCLTKGAGPEEVALLAGYLGLGPVKHRQEPGNGKLLVLRAKPLWALALRH